jgi:hypothetical protein
MRKCHWNGGKKFLLNTGNLKEDSGPMTLVQNWPEELRK